MSTVTQFNPNRNLNQTLLAAGTSKTVYALVTPETEAVKATVFGDAGSTDRAEYLSQFRDAWTGKQDAYHTAFFDKWIEWSSPVVDFDRTNFPFFYPTAGASEPLRQIIFSHAAKNPGGTIHVFEGEYEGYKAMAEAAGLKVYEHVRRDWRSTLSLVKGAVDLFCISQPSAIDGNVWEDFNEFVTFLPEHRGQFIVADVTYVGAVPESAIKERFNLNAPSIRNVVFSLSKPFGVYYDRVGGVFCREEDLGLFGNKWFKSLTALRIGTKLMEAHGVFDYPTRYAQVQQEMTDAASFDLDIDFTPADVYILATALRSEDEALGDYLRRGETLRICLTPGMADLLGTSGEIE